MIGEMPIKQVCLAFLAEIYGTFILVFFVMYSSCPDSTFLSSNIEKYVFVPLVVLMAREYSYRSQGLNPAFAIAF
jgi:glycerol uptake facilitator-like aquaporin